MVAEVQGRESEDKSTAAVSPSELEGPAVCAERPSELNDQANY